MLEWRKTLHVDNAVVIGGALRTVLQVGRLHVQMSRRFRSLSAVWGRNALAADCFATRRAKQPVVHLRKRFRIKPGAKRMPAFSSHSKRDESTG